MTCEILFQPFHSQDFITESRYRLIDNFRDVASENLSLGRLIIPLLIFFFILITCCFISYC